MQVMLRFFVCPRCKKESEVLFHTFQWVDEKGFKPPQCDENAEYKDGFIKLQKLRCAYERKAICVFCGGR
mgnify:FL=1